MTRPRLFPAFSISSAALALCLATGCTPKDEGEKSDDKAAKDDKAKSDAEAGDAKKKADDGDAKKADDAKKDGGGIADVVAEAKPDADSAGGTASNLPERGTMLGWLIARNPEELIGKVGKQVVPSRYAMYADVATLKTLAGAAGGPAAAVAADLDATKPIGCALIEDTVVDAPVACFFGYKGGAAAVSTDVGEGKQADAKGHVALHKMLDQDVFLDDLGDMVIATNQADLFGKSKDYLDKTLLPYAKTQRDDVSFIMFPAPAIKRYDSKLEPLMAMAGPTAPQTLEMYEEMASFEYGFALEPDGFHLRFGVAGEPGSSYAELIKAMETGKLDSKWIAGAPASAWLVTGLHMRMSAAMTSSSFTSMRDKMIEAYAKELSKDPTAVATALENYFKQAKELYGPSATMAFVHEKGTTGAVVVELEKLKDGRDAWKTWSEGFSVEDVLGKEGVDKVGWSFKEGAAEVDGVPADRWTIEPKKLDADMKALAKRFGGKLVLTIDRLELDDRVIFVLALSDIDASDKAAVAAAKGTATIADAPGGTDLIAAAPKEVGVLGVDLKRMFVWATEVIPEEAPFPAVGNDLSDVRFTTDVSGVAYEGDLTVSQATIDQIKGLIP